MTTSSVPVTTSDWATTSGSVHTCAASSRCPVTAGSDLRGGGSCAATASRSSMTACSSRTDLWDPYVPEVPGEFTGVQIHSGQYHNTDELAGFLVLVVGAGNSGCDLAVDAAQHRLEVVDLVIRRGVYFQPDSYFGVPASRWVPLRVPRRRPRHRQPAAGPGQSAPVVRQRGNPPPEHPTLAAGGTVINELHLYWIQHGRVAVRLAITGFEGRVACFPDDTRRETTRCRGRPGSGPACPSSTRRRSSDSAALLCAWPAGSSRSGWSGCTSSVWPPPGSADPGVRRAGQGGDLNDRPARAGR